MVDTSRYSIIYKNETCNFIIYCRVLTELTEAVMAVLIKDLFLFSAADESIFSQHC